MLLWSRQSGKSTTSAFIAIYTVLREPRKTVLVVGPGEDQAIEVLRMAKEIYEEAGRPIPARSYTEKKLVLANGSRILTRAAIEKTTRGYSPHLIIVDEAAQVDDLAFNSLRPSRIRTRADMILLSTPRGRRGFFSDLWHSENAWEKSMVTADQANVDPEILQEEKDEMHPDWFLQEYYCQFMNRINQVFTDEIVQGGCRGDHPPVDLGGIWL
jgi:hypothetical protein